MARWAARRKRLARRFAEVLGYVDLFSPTPGGLLAYGDPPRPSRALEELVEEVVEEAPASERRASSPRLHRVNVAQVLDPLAPSGDDTSDRDGRQSYATHVAHFSSHLITSHVRFIASLENILWLIHLRYSFELRATDE